MSAWRQLDIVGVMCGKKAQNCFATLFHLNIYTHVEMGFAVKTSPNLINYEWLQQMVYIIVYKNK